MASDARPLETDTIGDAHCSRHGRNDEKSREVVNCTHFIASNGSASDSSLITAASKDVSLLQEEKVVDISRQDNGGPVTLAMQRKRQREIERQSRRRKLVQVEQMKVTLENLMQQYQQLSVACAEQHRCHTGGGNPTTKHACLQKLTSNYNALADVSHALKEERFLLKKAWIEKQKTFQRIQQAMVDYQQECILPNPRLAVSVNDSLCSGFDFVPITEEYANERIHQCYQQICLLEEIAQPIMPEYDNNSAQFGSPSNSSLLSTFGWDISCKLTIADDLFACSSKFFSDVTAYNVMQWTWMAYKNPKGKLMPSRSVVRYEVLQQLNDTMYIAGIDLKHPRKEGVLMRGIHLLFHLQTNIGYAMGQLSLNPTSPDLRAIQEEQSSFEYVDSMAWMEFIPQIDDETGVEGCLMKSYGYTEYNTLEDPYLRLLNGIHRLLIWENAVMPSPVKLLSLS